MYGTNIKIIQAIEIPLDKEDLLSNLFYSNDGFTN